MANISLNELGWKDATLEYLSRLPVKDWPTQRELTKRLAISEQFYRYQLQLEGASYRALKQEVRMTRALHLLSSGSYRSIGEVSDDMGFCDEHSFRKVFKRWAGCSPTRYLIRHSPPRTESPRPVNSRYASPTAR
ncbi:helix-turn-helix domain-containing protein [Pseudomonas sp. P1B16]|uniref:helix-turn-helix domain-containing protein n=1 Tax=Pseudomonas sp. P1B16 TaxID=2986074 RepID=UPI002A243310|nr:helix-turn-helix domain-containing protein [Pseudomonas sp. P1B16]WPM28333.1 helix-turn-helix domain-containing protein [Pseudomonas sp. P1B16]